MAMRFAIQGSPELTSHEATGLSSLLASIGTPVSLKVSAKIDEAILGAAAIPLDDDERAAVLEAIDELSLDPLPVALAQVRSSIRDHAGAG
jgi:hypothetical protein